MIFNELDCQSGSNVLNENTIVFWTKTTVEYDASFNIQEQK